MTPQPIAEAAGPTRVLNVMLGVRSGGLERSVVSFHEALTAGGAEVVSVLSPGAWARGLFAPTRRVIEVETSQRFDFRARATLRAAVARERFDVVIAHGNRALKASFGLLERAPLVAVAHATNLNLAKFGHRFDAAILPGWAPERALRDLGPTTLAGRYSGLLRAAGVSDSATVTLPHALKADDWRRPAPPGDGVLTVGALGRFDKNKGFDVLLEAAKILKGRARPVRFAVAGADSDGSVATMAARRDAMGLTERDVILPGWARSPADFLGSLDVFCLPSRKETFGLALLEAMAAGRPVVASALADLEDSFVDGREGLFFPSEDPVALADALDALLRDPERRRTMGGQARLRAEAFDYAAVGPLYAAVATRFAAIGART